MSKKWSKSKPIKAREYPRDMQILSIGCVNVAASKEEGSLPTFEGVAYTGVPMRPQGWWDSVIIDLAGVKLPSQQQPALHVHSHEAIVGHTTSIRVTKEGIEVQGVFSGQQEHADKVVVPARNGFKWQMSVGANPIRKEYLESGKTAVVNGRKVTGPMVISRETELGEFSFVPLGADGKTSATVAATKGNIMNPFQAALKDLMAELKAAGKSCTYSDDEIDNMDQKGAKAALKKAMKAAEDDSDDDDEPKKAKAKSSAATDLNAEATTILAKFKADMKAENEKVAANQVRQQAIIAACREHGITECELEIKGTKTKVNLAAHAIQENWTVEQTELKAMKEARPGAGVGIPGGYSYSTTTPQANEAVLEAAILQASRHQFKLEDDSFYNDTMPDGKVVRRVSERMQREAQGGLKARYTDQIQQTAHTMFKGRIGLHQFFRAAMPDMRDSDLKSEIGWKSILSKWGQSEIQAGGASNMSISNILSNVLNKFALQGYLFTEQAWREIAGIRPVNDFKPTKSINLLGDVLYKQLGPTGQLVDASLEDQAFANQAAPYGRIITIPWTHLINDDLGMLGQVPMKIGQGAGLALNDYFWALWASLASGSVVGVIPTGTNLNGDDGNAFWRTSSSTTAAAKRAGTAYLPNKDTGAALSTTTLKSGKALFDNQIDPNGNPLGFDGSMPILLFGPSNWQVAMTILQSPVLVAAGLASTSAYTSAGATNIWAGSMKPVMSRYIENASYGNSTTAFWILFNPAALPVIEACFLNGVDTPSVLQAGPDYQFDKLGISIRGTMPFGVTQQQFRGGIYNAGA